MPYGICLWGEIAQKSFEIQLELDALGLGDVKEIKNIGQDLLFLRLSLAEKGLKFTLNLK
jgi:hypothetical protein